MNKISFNGGIVLPLNDQTRSFKTDIPGLKDVASINANDPITNKRFFIFDNLNDEEIALNGIKKSGLPYVHVSKSNISKEDLENVQINLIE